MFGGVCGTGAGSEKAGLPARARAKAVESHCIISASFRFDGMYLGLIIGTPSGRRLIAASGRASGTGSRKGSGTKKNHASDHPVY